MTKLHNRWDNRFCCTRASVEVYCVCLCVYQSLQPEVDVCLELRVVQDSPCEAEENTDALLQREEGAGLTLGTTHIYNTHTYT